MLFDLLFGIMISMIIVAPCMVIFNLEGHFNQLRKSPVSKAGVLT